MRQENVQISIKTVKLTPPGFSLNSSQDCSRLHCGRFGNKNEPEQRSLFVFFCFVGVLGLRVAFEGVFTFVMQEGNVCEECCLKSRSRIEKDLQTVGFLAQHLSFSCPFDLSM